MRLFSLRHDFPTEWAKFKSLKPTQNTLVQLSLELKPEHYPFWSRERLGTMQHAWLYADYTKDIPAEVKVAYRADDQEDDVTLHATQWKIATR